MKKIFGISLVSLLLLNPLFAQQIQESTSAQQTASINAALAGIKSLKVGIDEVTQELFELDAVEREKNENLSDAYRQARNEIVRVISGINETTEKISRSIERLAVYQTQIKILMEELVETRKSSDIAKGYLNEYLVLLYKIQLEMYDQQANAIDEIRLFINSDNISKSLVTEELTASMALQLKELIEQANSSEEKQIALLQRMGTLKQEAQNIISEYRDEVEKLQQKKNYLISFLELYKNKQVVDSQRFDKVFASKKEVHNSIQVFLDEIVKKNYKSVGGIPEKIAELSKMDDASDKETAPLARPIYPIEKILRYFNDPQFEIDNGFKHQGLQIEAEQRTPVYAMRDGVVYHVFDNMDSISRIMIVHQKGYVTTYQYLNQIIVEPGDIVQRGQLIGYSGGEPGTQGAGFVSEGENLTFTIYKDGVAVDPLTLLDLSVVTNWEEVLPDEYRIKYLNDNLVRPIDVSELKFENGENVDERSQSFLNRYAVGIYKDLNFWTTAVEGTNIDRDMVICVAFAESTLGNYLSTSNNIGNVGNNDRGDRIAYGTPYEGARLIASTMNNQYLGGYHTIKQLSRYGNEDGKIYASSPINWQTNVLKCLSRIKGYTIPEDFPFRTGPNPNLK
ncbi:MAG: peptidoglycan DD-metalloendopeptidase family protein [Candidatus Absconditabacteria bacterium]|nr:peptidoglycan DD-metalloendopeptidase family protein [Candidatus Absconditabacteria bacterium]MDD3868005.1 peptidoglycan DD-metalloendopeptidase family protein [Candidatus Absconditabacteria bacterium]MDD4714252.1 peptidoglycan DD-metalloendopeptidase family protein [Candidatus Absconditabacteria bacterium]